MPPLQQGGGFQFMPKVQPLDWESVLEIDVDSLQNRSADSAEMMETLEEAARNLVPVKIDVDSSEVTVDRAVHLAKLLQLCLEYTVEMASDSMGEMANEIDKLKEDLNESREEGKDPQGKVSRLEVEVADLTQDLQDALQKLDDYEQEIDLLRAELAEAKVDEEQRVLETELRREMDDLRSKNDRLQNELEKAESTVEMERQRSERLEQELREERSQLRSLRDQCKHLEEEVADLRGQLSLEQKMLQTKEEDDRDLMFKLQAKNRDLERYHRENKLLETHLGELQAKNEELLAEVLQLSDNIVQLDDAQKERDARISQLVAAAEEQEKDNQQLRQAMGDLQKEAAEKMMLLEQFEQRFAQMTKEWASREAELLKKNQELQTEADGLRRRLEEQFMMLDDEFRRRGDDAVVREKQKKLGDPEYGEGGNRVGEELRELRLQLRQQQGKEVLLLEAYEQLEKDREDEIAAALARQKGLMEKRERERRELMDDLEAERKRYAQLDNSLVEAQTERDEAVSRLADYEAGVYGLSAAMAEVRKLKRLAREGEDELHSCMKKLSESEQRMEELIEENLRLREMAGIADDTVLNLGDFRLRKDIELEELRALNAQLEKEVFDLEEERAELKHELRFRVKHHGMVAAQMGLTSKQLARLEKYAEWLRYGRVRNGATTAESRSLWEGDMEVEEEEEEEVARVAERDSRSRGVMSVVQWKEDGGSQQNRDKWGWASEGLPSNYSNNIPRSRDGQGGVGVAELLRERVITILERLWRYGDWLMSNNKGQGKRRRRNRENRGVDEDDWDRKEQRGTGADRVREHEWEGVKAEIGEVLKLLRQSPAAADRGGRKKTGRKRVREREMKDEERENRKRLLGVKASAGKLLRLELAEKTTVGSGTITDESAGTGGGGGVATEMVEASPKQVKRKEDVVEPHRGEVEKIVQGEQRSGGVGSNGDGAACKKTQRKGDVAWLQSQLIKALEQVGAKDEMLTSAWSDMEKYKEEMLQLCNQRSMLYREYIGEREKWKTERQRLEREVEESKQAAEEARAAAEEWERAAARSASADGSEEARKGEEGARTSGGGRSSREVALIRRTVVLQVKLIRMGRSLAAAREGEAAARRKAEEAEEECREVESYVRPYINYLESARDEGQHRRRVLERKLAESIGKQEYEDVVRQLLKARQEVKKWMEEKMSWVSDQSGSEVDKQQKRDSSRPAQGEEEIEHWKSQCEELKRVLLALEKKGGNGVVGAKAEKAVREGGELAVLRVSEAASKKREERAVREREMAMQLKEVAEGRVKEVEGQLREMARQLHATLEAEREARKGGAQELVDKKEYIQVVEMIEQLQARLLKAESEARKWEQEASASDSRLNAVVANETKAKAEIQDLRAALRDLEQISDGSAELGKMHERMIRIRQKEITLRRQLDRVEAERRRLKETNMRLLHKIDDKEAELFRCQENARAERTDNLRLIGRLQAALAWQVEGETARRWCRELLQTKAKCEQMEKEMTTRNEEIESLRRKLEEAEGDAERAKEMDKLMAEDKTIPEVYKHNVQLSQQTLSLKLTIARQERELEKLREGVAFLEKSDKEREERIRAGEEEAMRERERLQRESRESRARVAAVEEELMAIRRDRDLMATQLKMLERKGAISVREVDGQNAAGPREGKLQAELRELLRETEENRRTMFAQIETISKLKYEREQALYKVSDLEMLVAEKQALLRNADQDRQNLLARLERQIEQMPLCATCHPPERHDALQKQSQTPPRQGDLLRPGRGRSDEIGSEEEVRLGEGTSVVAKQVAVVAQATVDRLQRKVREKEEELKSVREAMSEMRRKAMEDIEKSRETIDRLNQALFKRKERGIKSMKEALLSLSKNVRGRASSSSSSWKKMPSKSSRRVLAWEEGHRRGRRGGDRVEEEDPRATESPEGGSNSHSSEPSPPSSSLTSRSAPPTPSGRKMRGQFSGVQRQDDQSARPLSAPNSPTRGRLQHLVPAGSRGAADQGKGEDGGGVGRGETREEGEVRHVGGRWGLVAPDAMQKKVLQWKARCHVLEKKLAKVKLARSTDLARLVQELELERLKGTSKVADLLVSKMKTQLVEKEEKIQRLHVAIKELEAKLALTAPHKTGGVATAASASGSIEVPQKIPDPVEAQVLAQEASAMSLQLERARNDIDRWKKIAEDRKERCARLEKELAQERQTTANASAVRSRASANVGVVTTNFGNQGNKGEAHTSLQRGREPSSVLDLRVTELEKRIKVLTEQNRKLRMRVREEGGEEEIRGVPGVMGSAWEGRRRTSGGLGAPPRKDTAAQYKPPSDAGLGREVQRERVHTVEKKRGNKTGESLKGVLAGLAGGNNDVIERWEEEKKLRKRVDMMRSRLMESRREAEEHASRARQADDTVKLLETEKNKLRERIRALEAASRAAGAPRFTESTADRIKEILAQMKEVEVENEKLRREAMVEKEAEINRLKREVEALRLSADGNAERDSKQRATSSPSASRGVDARRSEPLVEVEEEERLMRWQELEKEVEDGRKARQELEDRILARDNANLELRFEKEQALLEGSRLRARLKCLFDEELWPLSAGKAGVEPGGGSSTRVTRSASGAIASAEGKGSTHGGGRVSSCSGRGSRELELEAVVESLTKVVEKLRTENEGLKKNVASNAKYMDVLNKNKELKKKVGDLTEEVEKVREDRRGAEEVRRRSVRLEETNTSLRKQLRKEREEIKRLNRAVQDAERERRAAETRIPPTRDGEDEQDRVGESDQMIRIVQSLEEQLQSGSDEIRRLKEELAARGEMIEQLREEVDRREDELDLLNGELAIRSAVESQELQELVGKLTERVADLEREKELLLADTTGDEFPGAPATIEASAAGPSHARLLQNARKEVAKWKGRYAQVVKELERVRTENERLKEDLEALDPGFFEEIEDLRTDHQRLSQMCKEYEVLLANYARRLGVPFAQTTF
ncbi:hypothetical protein CBR_g11994 [Chara braunii]|uniref:Cilium assembly protein DZIP1 N-terminal domain-containing protein n=1 Tax=Chara braunii TaxID=69332 RepID=A0A388KQS8_CHABU|nr:hypothetical protein CBR_g11994 [Chara braunii]|eukprot:GBG72415.1 hypothetical protein CBR_g11994 [Chara braunii]